MLRVQAPLRPPFWNFKRQHPSPYPFPSVLKVPRVIWINGHSIWACAPQYPAPFLSLLVAVVTVTRQTLKVARIPEQTAATLVRYLVVNRVGRYALAFVERTLAIRVRL